MKYYDVDGDGNITYEEFIRGLREELSERKQKIVKKAFVQLDKDGSGVVTVSDISHLYNVQQHPDFKNHKKTKDQLLADFLDGFDGARGNNDGKVTWLEFLDYYTDLAMSLPSEDYFVQMIESVWGISEDSGSNIH